MMRVTRVVLVWMALVVSAGAVQAQTPATEGRYYAEFAAAATLGHKSASSIGVEAGARLTNQIEIFVEGGHMGNVGTSDLDARAATIAGFIGGSANAVQRANYFDVGVKYRFPVVVARMWRPYVGFAAGAAKVETLVTFSVGGNDVTSQLSSVYGVELGKDLTDSLNKTLIVVPVGVQGTFMQRFLVDVSYRYGRILARPADIDQDVAISAQRIQVGVGLRF